MLLQKICKGAENNRISQKLKAAKNKRKCPNALCDLGQKSKTDDVSDKHDRLLGNQGMKRRSGSRDLMAAAGGLMKDKRCGRGQAEEDK